jgi:membrane-bound serine protease (ClpP class)
LSIVASLPNPGKTCYNWIMSKKRRFYGLFFLSIGMVLFYTPAHVSAQNGKGKAWIIPIQGDIEPSLTAFVRREARKALAEGADCLIFEIDTFGGRVDSALQITSFIMSVKNARTIAWVNNSENSMGVSWSAGALIAFSCQNIFMAPGTSMGAAAPVVQGAGGEMEGAGEKSVAAVRSQMAALAEKNGYPVGLALAMVDYDVELWDVTVDGQTRALTLGELERLEKEGLSDIERVGIISQQGKLLSLSAGEALRYGLASGLVETREDLFSAINFRGEIVETSPSGADLIISLLTSAPVQTILILLALVMIFLELQTPGFGIPGITAVISFLIVFGTSALLGRVGSLEIILLLGGLGLLAVELFVIPGFGVVGISGFICIGISLVLSMQDFVIPRFDWEWALFGRNALVVFIGLLAAITGIAIIALLGPRLKMFDRIMLKAQITGTAGGPDPDSPAGKEIILIEDEENLSALVGKIGVADSILRPAGKAVINDKVYSVEADNEFIDSGRGIIVTRVRGNRIIVRRV